MTSRLSFPADLLKLTLLYQDAAELEKIKAVSTAKSALSKVSAVYHDLYFPAPTDERPYTFASIVLSLDGKMAFQDNPQGPVVASANAIDPSGGLTDFWVLNVLRAHADGIMVGAKTLQAEPDVVCTCLDPDLIEERRTRLGKPGEHPLNIITSLDGKDIPFGHPIFDNPEIKTLITTCRQGGQYIETQLGGQALLLGPFNSPAEIDGPALARQIEQALQAGKRVALMAGEDAPNANMLLYALRQIGIQHLLIESPTYMWLLMQQGMLDEFFVDYSTLFIGGPITPGYANGFSYLNHPHSKFLVIAMHNNSFLFTRQKLIYGLSTPK